jgi:hypothetical protein
MIGTTPANRPPVHGIVKMGQHLKQYFFFLNKSELLRKLRASPTGRPKRTRWPSVLGHLRGRPDTRTTSRVRVSVWVARGAQRGDPKRRHVVRLRCAALRHGRPRRDSHGGRWNARERSRAHQGSRARENTIGARSRPSFPPDRRL